MATPQQENPLFHEGRILLSINAYKKGQFTSFQKATDTYNVLRTTAQRRAKGTKPKRGSAASNRRLTPVQEETLKQWILSMDQRGMAPRIAIVRQMASLLAAQHQPGSKPVGKRWVYDYIKRHNDLQSK